MKRILIIAMFIMGGCSPISRKSGDFSMALIDHLRSCGATIPSLTRLDLPAINTTWSITQDDFGFVIQLPPERFTDVDVLLRQLFGVPKLWDGKNLEGCPQGMFSAAQIGVHLQYVRSRDRTEVICIKKQKKTQNQAPVDTARRLVDPQH